MDKAVERIATDVKKIIRLGLNVCVHTKEKHEESRKYMKNCLNLRED